MSVLLPSRNLLLINLIESDNLWNDSRISLHSTALCLNWCSMMCRQEDQSRCIKIINYGTVNWVIRVEIILHVFDGVQVQIHTHSSKYLEHVVHKFLTHRTYHITIPINLTFCDTTEKGGEGRYWARQVIFFSIFFLRIAIFIFGLHHDS